MSRKDGTPEPSSKGKGSEPVVAITRTNVGEALAKKALAELTKRFGDKLLSKGTEIPDTLFVPYGISQLDYSLGGGVPVGRFTHIVGESHSGKTTLALKATAQFQRTCVGCYRTDYAKQTCACGKMVLARCLWVDAERCFDPKWAAAQGVDLAALTVARPVIAEEAVDTVDFMLRSATVDFVVIDSIAAFVPAKFQEDEAGKAHPGTHAKLVYELLNKLLTGQATLGRMDPPKLCTVLYLNQLRFKITMFGDPRTSTGGGGPTFHAAHEFWCSKAKYEMDTEGFPLTGKFKVRIEKNKVGRSTKTELEYQLCLADTDLRAPGTPMDEDWIVDKAQEAEIVKGGGPRWTALGREFNSKSGINKAILEDKQFGAEFRAHVLAVLLEASR